MGLPAAWRARGLLGAADGAAALPPAAGLRAVVSGSCSIATLGQVAAAIRRRRPGLPRRPAPARRGEDVAAAALAWAAPLLAAGPVLVYATAEPDAVRAAQERLGRERAGALVEEALAAIARGLVERGVGQLIVAGGETSGAVVNALGVRVLRIGPEIAPGVPWTASVGGAALSPSRSSPATSARPTSSSTPGRCCHDDGDRAARADVRARALALRAGAHRRHERQPISARLDDGLLLTPTNSCLGRLDPARLSKLDPDGRSSPAIRRRRRRSCTARCTSRARGAGGVVHLHSTHAAAVSCLAGLDPADALPPLTPYFVMKIGRLPLVPYHRPGDPRSATSSAGSPARHPAVLLANHGPVVSGATLDDAVYAAEELEETAKLFLLLRGQPVRTLTPEQIDELKAVFKLDL